MLAASLLPEASSVARACSIQKRSACACSRSHLCMLTCAVARAPRARGAAALALLLLTSHKSRLGPSGRPYLRPSTRHLRLIKIVRHVEAVCAVCTSTSPWTQSNRLRPPPTMQPRRPTEKTRGSQDSTIVMSGGCWLAASRAAAAVANRSGPVATRPQRVSALCAPRTAHPKATTTAPAR